MQVEKLRLRGHVDLVEGQPATTSARRWQKHGFFKVTCRLIRTWDLRPLSSFIWKWIIGLEFSPLTVVFNFVWLAKRKAMLTLKVTLRIYWPYIRTYIIIHCITVTLRIYWPNIRTYIIMHCTGWPPPPPKKNATHTKACKVCNFP